MDEKVYDTLKQTDGYITKIYSYQSKEKPIGTVLILHGMAEHHGRYSEFIQYLNKAGFDVFTYDHRGHGVDKKFSELGYFAHKNGAAKVVNDAVAVLQFVEKNKRTSGFALFGHSMGSIIARCAMQEYDGMNCVLLSGATMPSNAKMRAGLFLANIFCTFSPEKEGRKLDDIMHANKFYADLCERTQFDWLSKNNTSVGQYINDPYSGFVCRNTFYRDLMKLVLRSDKLKNIVKTRKNLPVFLFAGDKDPVGSYGSEIFTILDTMKSLGFNDVGMKLYENDRHEILNELDSDIVMNDMKSYLLAHINCPTDPSDTIVPAFEISEIGATESKEEKKESLEDDPERAKIIEMLTEVSTGMASKEDIEAATAHTAEKQSETIDETNDKEKASDSSKAASSKTSNSSISEPSDDTVKEMANKIKKETAKKTTKKAAEISGEDAPVKKTTRKSTKKAATQETEN